MNNLNIVAVREQKIICQKKWDVNHDLQRGSFVHQEIRSAIKQVEFISDRIYDIKRLVV